MKKWDVFPAWGRLLAGRRPFLSIEITKECPLRCPGCYAYEPEHLGGEVSLRRLSDFRGEELVRRVLALLRELRPLHVSIVGGEPLVRYRELDRLLPELDRMGVEVQLVTSAVRRIPPQWAQLSCLHIAVSVDGLPAEHDRRRAPATYARILEHIAGHSVIVHCTITRPIAYADYLEEFSRFWSSRPECRRIWFSLFTPQQDQESVERLFPEDRQRVVDALARIRAKFPKVHLPEGVLKGYLRPPSRPDECIFARTTTCISPDLKTQIAPCQFGGRPACTECGCMASAGLAAIGNVRLVGLIAVHRIFRLSCKFGEVLSGNRRARHLPEATQLPEAAMEPAPATTVAVPSATQR
ncbi:MAG: radical SAM protein [Bryobacteraceae bacterium]